MPPRFAVVDRPTVVIIEGKSINLEGALSCGIGTVVDRIEKAEENDQESAVIRYHHASRYQFDERNAENREDNHP